MIQQLTFLLCSIYDSNFNKQLLSIAAQIAYPRRGTPDETKTIYDYANEIEELFKLYNIDHQNIEYNFVPRD